MDAQGGSFRRGDRGVGQPHGQPRGSPTDDISRVTSAAEEDEGRFVSGTLLGGRYRIIGLLGRGGMGEVYRATDLTLGQSVALKFLPEEASRNQRLLERFHGEVRVARLVSHPNVCRVYDIGEIEGMPFISMEYVDGEDLASLLLRIGRLPADKALETARKLCAGLTAAHDRGVIHRDLKPQNIMINKRGEIVIMDFGLAAISDQLSGAEVRNGTPAYMAPEQLKGTGVTARSDIYALGLVLYELFTGKRPYDAKNVQQLIDLQDSVNLTSMTSVAADIDPAVEKVIRRCLDPDPAKRPANALAVAAALPGGDPLAAALAAGETPSPEMVAAAGTVEGMPRKWAMFCLLLTVASCSRRSPFASSAPPSSAPPWIARRTCWRTSRAPPPRASDTPASPPTATSGWSTAGTWSAICKLCREPRHWDEWYAAEAPIVSFYRESPQPLDARPFGLVTTLNPPPLSPGMVTVVLDGNGRLRDFAAVPYDDGSAPVPPETVFRAAGLDMAGVYRDRSAETAEASVRPVARVERAAPEDPQHRTAGGDRLLEGTDHRATVSIRPAETGAAPVRPGDLGHLQEHRRRGPWRDLAGSSWCCLRTATGSCIGPTFKAPGAWRCACFLLAGSRLGRHGSSGAERGVPRTCGGRRRRLAACGGDPVPGISGAGTGGARALAALHRHLESRAGGALAGCRKWRRIS